MSGTDTIDMLDSALDKQDKHINEDKKAKVNDAEDSDEISDFLSKMHNKYSGNADQKNLNRFYDIGILMTNKKFNKEKMLRKLNNILDEKSQSEIKEIRESKKLSLLKALEKGIEDGMSPEYREAYDSANKYRFSDRDKLKKRAYIDGVVNKFLEDL